MADKIDLMKVGLAGGLAGVLTYYILKPISYVLNWAGQYTPTLTAKLANPAIDINVRGSLTGINTGLAGWMTNALGLTVPESLLTALIMSFVGGAVMFIAGAYLAETFGQLKGTPVYKTGVTIFAGSLIAVVAIAWGTGSSFPLALDISTVNVLIAMGLNATVLAVVYNALEKNIRPIGLIPY